MLICFIRHGETEWNRAKKLQGRCDIPLSPIGREQANKIGRLLTKEKWHVIVTSPLLRAKETANIIFEYVKPIYFLEDCGIIEKDFGEATGMEPELRNKLYKDRNYPHMETDAEIENRVSKSLNNIISDFCDKNVLVISHSSVIKTILHLITGHHKDKYGVTLLPGGVSIVSYEKDKGFDVMFANQDCEAVRKLL